MSVNIAHCSIPQKVFKQFFLENLKKYLNSFDWFLKMEFLCEKIFQFQFQFHLS